MNRFQVIEAIVDGNKCRIQALNLHPNFTSIYWHYPSKDLEDYKRLQIIDTKLQIVYDWQGCQNMMIVENLMRIRNGLRIQHLQSLDLLKSMQYIDENYQLSNRGIEHLEQFERKTQYIQLQKIDSTIKLYSPL